MVNKRVDKPEVACKSVSQDQPSKKNRRVETKSKSKFLMDGNVSIGPTLNTEISSKPSTADTSSNKSGQQDGVTQVSPTRAAKQSKCVRDCGKQARVDKPATMCKSVETSLDLSKKNRRAHQVKTSTYEQVT